MSAIHYAKVTLCLGIALFLGAVLFETLDTVQVATHAVSENGREHKKPDY